MSRQEVLRRYREKLRADPVRVAHQLEGQRKRRAENPGRYPSKPSQRRRDQANIDRIDQFGGYTQANCRLVVEIFNTARGQYSDETLRILVEALHGKL